MPGLPDLLVLKLPPELRAQDEGQLLSLEHKICIVEDDGNRRIALDSLAKPLPVEGNLINWKLSLDRVMGRRSSLPRGEFTVMMYVPPAEGWPWLVVTNLGFNVPNEGYARERYGWDAFPNAETAQTHMMTLDAQLPLRVKRIFLSPEGMKVH